MTTNYPAQNVNDVEVEKAWARGMLVYPNWRSPQILFAPKLSHFKETKGTSSSAYNGGSGKRGEQVSGDKTMAT